MSALSKTGSTAMPPSVLEEPASIAIETRSGGGRGGCNGGGSRFRPQIAVGTVGSGVWQSCGKRECVTDLMMSGATGLPSTVLSGSSIWSPRQSSTRRVVSTVFTQGCIRGTRPFTHFGFNWFIGEGTEPTLGRVIESSVEGRVFTCARAGTVSVHVSAQRTRSSPSAAGSRVAVRI